MAKLTLYSRDYLIQLMRRNNIKGANKVTLNDWQNKGIVLEPQHVEIVGKSNNTKRYLYTKREIERNLKRILAFIRDNK